MRRGRTTAVVISSAALVAAGGAVFERLRRAGESLDAPLAAGKELRLVPVPPRGRALAVYSGDEVEGVAQEPEEILTAGAGGVLAVDARGQSREIAGLPTRAASALALWRSHPTVGLVEGGLFVRRDGRWDEAVTGYGTLHVRCLLEGPGGELYVGAREGLFKTAWASASFTRLHADPVRSIALGSGFVLAGGEKGLARVEASRVEAVAVPDPWVESVGIERETLWVVTAAGLARGPVSGLLLPVAGGADVSSGVTFDGGYFAIAGGATPPLRRYDENGHASVVWLPSPPRRLLVEGGALFVDTEEGLYRIGSGGQAVAPRLVRSRAAGSLPPGSSHVGALALFHGRPVAGVFDGGLVLVDGSENAMRWRKVGSASIWGVNALLAAGGELFVASLRGAARYDGARVIPLEGPGAAFSLCATRSGVAIGYGQGVLVPGSRLLSAFHGLPGNQALALASGPFLFVGTPSGLGALDGDRVSMRIVGADGRLPHPCVTALARITDRLFVGTNGGGLASIERAGPKARVRPYPETAGLRINPGCLLALSDGTILAGTDGHGTWRLSPGEDSFVPMALPLPSPRVTALCAEPATLLVGTDQGIARVPLPATHALPSLAQLGRASGGAS